MDFFLVVGGVVATEGVTSLIQLMKFLHFPGYILRNHPHSFSAQKYGENFERACLSISNCYLLKPVSHGCIFTWLS